MRNYFTTFILLFSVSFGEDYAGLSGSFLRVGMTARSIAMGGAFTAEKDHGFAAFNIVILLDANVIYYSDLSNFVFKIEFIN